MYNEILGVWKLDPNDITAEQLYSETSMEFKDTGELIYIIYVKDKEYKMLMSYKIIGNLLITDQPSNPRQEETEFRILTDGKLELCFGGVKSIYIKVQ